LSRISLAFKSFFAILFGDGLPEQVAKAFGYVRESQVKAATPAKPAPEIRASDGALQVLSILQRDARLIDFLMEDIGAYSDEQVGAAVRSLHEQSRTVLSRYLTLRPVIDAVEARPRRSNRAIPTPSSCSATYLPTERPAREFSGTVDGASRKSTFPN